MPKATSWSTERIVGVSCRWGFRRRGFADQGKARASGCHFTRLHFPKPPFSIPWPSECKAENRRQVQSHKQFAGSQMSLNFIELMPRAGYVESDFQGCTLGNSD